MTNHTGTGRERTRVEEQLVSALNRELQEADEAEPDPGNAPAAGLVDADTTPQRAMAASMRQLSADRDVTFPEEFVKDNLRTILTALVGSREGETHGKALIGELDALFGARLSPGTVYPELHDLDDRDLLSVHERVRTKEYYVSDDRAVRELLQQEMETHLAFGLFLLRISSELDAGPL